MQNRSVNERPSANSPLSLIVVTYNSAAVLPGLLDSLADGLCGLSDIETVIVDNASQDGSADLAARHPVRPKVIRMGRNAGYAAGINAATSSIEPDRHVLILNPDIRLRPGVATRLLERLQDVRVGVVVPRMLNEDGSVALSLRREPSIAAVWLEAFLGRWASRTRLSEVIGDPKLYDLGGPVEWATGAALAVSAHARATIGDWDESFFLYSEEVDYLRRMREHNFSIIYAPNAEVMHIGGEYRENPMLSALLARNRIQYFRRYHGKAEAALFQLGIVTGAAMRSFLGPTHRAALRASLRPSRLPI